MPYSEQHIISRYHWSDKLFTFKTTRPPELSFKEGEFVTLGLRPEGKLIVRAFSIVSTPRENHLEFLSIHVPHGPLTSHLVHVQPGDPIWVNTKATGTLTVDHIQTGRHLFMLATGTGVAPFISLIRGGEIFRRFERVILVHTVREAVDLVYRDELTACAEHQQAGHFLYYPTVTRQAFANTGRGSDLFQSGELFEYLHLPPADADYDRVMLCGNPAMNAQMTAYLEAHGWTMTSYKGIGNFTVEKAFVLDRD